MRLDDSDLAMVFVPMFLLVILSATYFLTLFIMRKMLPDVFAWNSPVSDLTHAVALVSLLGLSLFPFYSLICSDRRSVPLLPMLVVFAMLSTTYLLTSFLALHLSALTVLGFMGIGLTQMLVGFLTISALPFLLPFLLFGMTVLAGFTFKSFIAPAIDLFHCMAYALLFGMLCILASFTANFYFTDTCAKVTNRVYSGRGVDFEDFFPGGRVNSFSFR